MMTRKGIDLLDFVRSPAPPPGVGATSSTSSSILPSWWPYAAGAALVVVGVLGYGLFRAVQKTNREVSRQRGELLRQVGGVGGLLALGMGAPLPRKLR